MRSSIGNVGTKYCDQCSYNARKNKLFRKQLRKHREEHVKMQAEIGVMHTRIQEGQEPTKPGRSQDSFCLEGVTPGQHSGFGLWVLEMRENKFLLF